jgi:hypothetical protein
MGGPLDIDAGLAPREDGRTPSFEHNARVVVRSSAASSAAASTSDIGGEHESEYGSRCLAAEASANPGSQIRAGEGKIKASSVSKLQPVLPVSFEGFGDTLETKKARR